MQHRNGRERRDGFTLIEAMITLAILGIVVVIGISNFQGMMEKYRVEGETKQMFADLMDVRARAMQRNRVFFVQISSNGYKTVEDTTPAPNGNNNLESSDTQVANVNVKHTVTPTGGLSDFRFNRNGIASATGTIQFSSNAQPDYNCITIRPTRIKMGQINAGTCVEK